jgi:glycosyltransferase involved in cell wall biosynthesis
MRMLVAVLAYNEAEIIEKVIAAAKRALDAEILVIDDGSQDGTQAKALAAGVRCISLPVNAGIGVAEQVAFMVAAEEGFEALIRIDGDGQHPPEALPLIAATLAEEDADLVVGSRYVNGYRQPHGKLRRLGTRFLSAMLRASCGVAVTDATSGFRGYSRRAIEVFACDYPDDFPEVEAILDAGHMGMRVREVPMAALGREYGDSVIKPSVAVYYMSKVSLSIAVGVLRKLTGSHRRETAKREA